MTAKREPKGRGKSIQKLKLKKETIKDLGANKARDVKGGMQGRHKTQGCTVEWCL